MTGAWDLEFRTVENLIRTSDILISTLQGLSKHTSAHLIWVSTVAFPDKNGNRRNNVAIQASNAYIRKRIKGLNITEIDSFSILEHRNNEPIRRDHYFGPLKRTTYFVGSVGYVLANEMIKAICDF